MQPATAVSDPGEIAVVQRMAAEESEHQTINHAAQWLHHVVDQAIAAFEIGMQEPTGHIESLAAERLADSRLQHAVGVVEAGIHRVNRAPGQASSR